MVIATGPTSTARFFAWSSLPAKPSASFSMNSQAPSIWLVYVESISPLGPEYQQFYIGSSHSEAGGMSAGASFTFGVLAALGAPMVMTVGFMVWDNHWQGSAFALNLFKCNFASIFFLIATVISRKIVAGEESALFDTAIFTRENVGFLFLSSTVGILIGDWTWLEALRMIGARRVILIDSVKPFIAALFGWFVLGEEFENSIWEIFAGMALTVVGVVIVSLEKEKNSRQLHDNGMDETDQVGDESSREYEKTETDTGEGDARSMISSQVQLTNVVGDEEGKNPDTFENFETDIESKDNEVGGDRSSSTTANQGIPRKKFRRRSTLSTPTDLRKGFVLAALNVILDTYGSVLTKEHGVNMTTWEINLLRFGFAGACMAVLACLLVLREKIVQRLFPELKGSRLVSHGDVGAVQWFYLPHMPRNDWLFIVSGVALVTFLTPALSNYALFQIALALTLTLTSIGPVYALSLWWLQTDADPPSKRSWFGALLAIAGVMVLSFRGGTA